MNQQKRKQVAIVLDELSIGGIPKACVPFANQLAKYCDVTMILCNQRGELIKQLVPQIQIKIFENSRVTSTFVQRLKKGKTVQYAKKLAMYLFHTYVTKRWVKSSVLISQEREWIIPEEFDCAIAYHGMSISQLTRTLYQIKAKKKIAWIHGEHPFEGIHKQDVQKVYDEFDLVYISSKATKENFLQDFPVLKYKTEVYYNLLEPDKIRQKSKAPVDTEFDFQMINLVTVGRISPEKGQDMIPTVLEILIEKGYKIQWYIVGDGEDRARIETIVKNKKLSKYISFIGSKTNPYPYMKNCDIYVQPSYAESYGLTIFEAAIIGKAVVATDVGGAKEHLCHGKDCILVEPNPKSIAEGIDLLLRDSAKKQEMENNLMKHDFSNESEIQKILSWLEG